MKSELINDEQRLVSATSRFGHPVKVYDDGFGPLFIHRDSMGISGIVRAQTWEDAYGICEDEFFPSADAEAFEKMPGDQQMTSGAGITQHEEDCWNEAYGFRPNGKGGPTPDDDRGVYAKDLNGDRLDVLTPTLLAELEISLVVEPWETAAV
jgi:hypothetical protein